MVPSQVPLPLVKALDAYDARRCLSHRRFVPPTFREVRQILNTATLDAVAPRLRLLTLDADETIYEDGGTLTSGSPMVGLLGRLLNSGLDVALVTAAGYNDPEKYEVRLEGLLDSLQLCIDLGAPRSMLRRFHVMGGECNYLMRCVVRQGRVRLVTVPSEEWKDGRGVRWDPDAIVAMLDQAETSLRETAARMGLDVKIIRKDRAVGMVRDDSAAKFPYELLEEITLATQHALRDCSVPHCAFNGGADCWVDVGNKSLGIRALQTFLGVHREESLHVGDRFTRTGNDYKAREVASTLWVAKPQETEFYLRLLLRRRESGGRASPASPKARRGKRRPRRSRSRGRTRGQRTPGEGGRTLVIARRRAHSAGGGIGREEVEIPSMWSALETAEGEVVGEIRAARQVPTWSGAEDEEGGSSQAEDELSAEDQSGREDSGAATEDDDDGGNGDLGEASDFVGLERKWGWHAGDEQRLNAAFDEMDAE